jgi:chromosome segregation ATPase
MGTYDYKKVLSEYDNGRMTVDMAVGHSLQHIGKLYEAQTAANASHRAWQAKVDRLEDALKTLQAEVDRWQKRQTQTDRLQQLENALTALNLTVYKIKDDVDHLKARLSNADAGEPSAKN